MFQPNAPFDVPADVMRYYRERAPDAEYVALQGYGIQDLVPLMGHLAELPRMKHLNLSSNELSRLPEDMSKLRNLEVLNLSFNNFQHAAAVAKGLFSLPKLAHLHINLPEEEEEYLITTLANLKTLNGVVLDDEPQKALPATPEEMLDNIRQLPPKPPRGYNVAGTVGPSELQVAPWTSDDTEHFTTLQAAVARVSGQASHPEEYADFQRLVTTHLRARTKSEPDPLRRAQHDFNAASLLCEYSFDELTRACSKFGPELSHAMQLVFASHVALMQRASHTMAAMQLDRDSKVAALQEDLARELLMRDRARIRDGVDARASVGGGYNDETMSTLNVSGGAAGTQPQQQQGGGDVIPLPELRSLMNILFESKKRHDEANRAGNLPRETLEQHLYTYYYARSKSDDDIRNKVTRVFRSVKRHSKTDLSVEVFSLILKSEVEEQYWAEHNALTDTVFDLVHSALTGNGAERGATLNGVLTEGQVEMIVKTLFPGQDTEPLLRVVAKSMARVSEVGAAGLMEELLGIGYRDFVAIVLQHALASHRLAIKSIVAEFHAVDEEATGVVDVNQFKQIMGRLFPGLSSVRCQEIVEALDPGKNNVITFSDTVVYVQRLRGPPPAKQQIPTTASQQTPL